MYELTTLYVHYQFLENNIREGQNIRDKNSILI